MSGLEDCLRLLRSDRDEQRLAGLLLATKFCHGDDTSSILKVYHATGSRFLGRLLKTGMKEGGVGGKGSEEREAYLRLSVTVLAAFCRVPEIAGSEDMVSKVPAVVEVISKVSDPVIYEECYEILLLTSSASKGGLQRLYESEVISALASNISILPDGSRSVELAMQLLQLLITQLPLDLINIKDQSHISCIVQAVARQFGVLQSGLKFDALHLLTAILSSDFSVALEDLKRGSDEDWTSYIHCGALTILQNRIWGLLLVLESSRVEVAVLLNEISYLKYETAECSSAYSEALTLKHRHLAVSFSIIEKIIKLIVKDNEATGGFLDERTALKAIDGLNETIDLLLDFLHDAKDHGQRKGDYLLASVRLLGSYLAEVPFASKEKVNALLRYLLSIEGGEEERPFYSICFMLPMLCQLTMETEGCKLLASFGGHKMIADYLVEVIGPAEHIVEKYVTAFMACDIILNMLLNMRNIQFELDDNSLVPLLRSLAIWADKDRIPSVTMMASSICALIFDLTSEESLMKSRNFDQDTLQSLSKLLATSWDASEQDTDSSSTRENHDLHKLVLEGYDRWRNRFPHVRGVVEGSR